MEYTSWVKLKATPLKNFAMLFTSTKELTRYQWQSASDRVSVTECHWQGARDNIVPWTDLHLFVARGITKAGEILGVKYLKTVIPSPCPFPPVQQKTKRFSQCGDRNTVGGWVLAAIPSARSETTPEINIRIIASSAPCPLIPHPPSPHSWSQGPEPCSWRTPGTEPLNHDQSICHGNAQLSYHGNQKDKFYSLCMLWVLQLEWRAEAFHDIRWIRRLGRLLWVCSFPDLGKIHATFHVGKGCCLADFLGGG